MADSPPSGLPPSGGASSGLAPSGAQSSGARCRNSPLPDVRKIAVLRANALGDFIFTLPALQSLRQAYPDSELVLLGKQWHAAFLRWRPGPIDRVVVVPGVRGVTIGRDEAEDASGVRQFLEEMRAERFDLALQLFGGGRHSNPLVKQLGAGLTAGMRAPDAPHLDREIPYVYFQSEVQRLLEVVALVGGPDVPDRPSLILTERDAAEAEAALPARRQAGLPLAVLHPGAGEGRRRWPEEKFAAVGRELAQAGACVVVTGSEEERPMTARVAGAMRDPDADLGGRVTIGGLAGLLHRAAVMVSNDSGPLHLARAVGAATVGIYWCGNLINAGAPTRARHRPVLSWRLNCPVCGVNCIDGLCDHHESFVAEVPVKEVARQALDLLSDYVRT